MDKNTKIIVEAPWWLIRGLPLGLMVMMTFFILAVWAEDGSPWRGVPLFLLVLVVAFAIAVLSYFRLEIDQKRIYFMSLRGIYELRWSDIVAVDKRNHFLLFFAEEKVLIYNVGLVPLMADDVYTFVDDLVEDYEIRAGRPKGMSKITVKEMSVLRLNAKSEPRSVYLQYAFSQLKEDVRGFFQK